MKENPALNAFVVPDNSDKSYLVVEHLTYSDVLALGETPAADSHLRLSLCDTPNGNNPITVYELLLDEDAQDDPIAAQNRVGVWASGYILGARHAGKNLKLIFKSGRLT